MKTMNATKKRLYEDQYAHVSFVESIPCIKVKLSGHPRCSEHYQYVHWKLLECIHAEINNYCRLHVLMDSTSAGPVLEEDINYYKMNIIPELEKAGVRYHAVVMPQSLFARLLFNEVTLSTKRLKVAYFESVGGGVQMAQGALTANIFARRHRH